MINFSELKQGDVRSKYSHLGIFKLLLSTKKASWDEKSSRLHMRPSESDYVVTFRNQKVGNHEELSLCYTSCAHHPVLNHQF